MKMLYFLDQAGRNYLSQGDVRFLPFSGFQALPQADKDRYELRAKEEKRKTQTGQDVDRNRMDNMGNVIAVSRTSSELCISSLHFSCLGFWEEDSNIEFSGGGWVRMLMED